jgi:5'-nucleotidase
MNALGFHAMTLGNHEFDDGDEKLKLFIKGVSFPIVSANLDVSQSPDLKDLVKPFTIVEVGGQKIGVIGVTTVDTKNNSYPGKGVAFNPDYAGCVQESADRLEQMGVNKIVVLSHIGLDEDRKLAAKISKIDAIVGGHSHTLLSNTYKEAKDVYPVVVKDRDERPVYVVQAGGGDGRFIGRLNLEFDAAGVVTKASGDCVHLSHFIPSDPDAQEKVDAMTKRVADLMGKPIVCPDGRDARALDDFPVKDVRDAETAIGNLATDAMRKRAGADAAVLGGGSIRNSIPEGPITLGTLVNAFPFNNTLCVVRVKGKGIVEALEHGLSRYSVESGRGRFLHVSGLRYTFDRAKPVGQRVIGVDVLGEGGYGNLDPDRLYKVACDSYLFGGGDDFTMLKEKAESSEDLGYPVRGVLQQYIAERSPIRAKLEGRIVRK